MTWDAPLDERYLEWLYSLVGTSHQRYPARYWKLCEQLYNTPFHWFVPNDDNRVEDARALREEFFNLIGDSEPTWYQMDASILEMLIALSRRIGDEMDEEPGTWFWIMIEHLNLDDLTDDVWNKRASREVQRTTDMLVNRTYARNGAGGLFPLKHPPRDQRKVEIWYQKSAYLLELMGY